MYRLVALVIVSLAPSIGLGCVYWLADGQAESTGGEETSYARLSPFSAVRWQGDRPQVQVGEDWYALSKIDGLSTDEIVEFCVSEYRSLAHKRFDEDLVEVLTRMGHEPGPTSTLTVSDLATKESMVLKNIEWTEANRFAIKTNNDVPRATARKNTRSLLRVSRTDPQFAKSVDTFMEAARKKTGFNGAVIIAQGNQVLYSKSLGHADLEGEIPNTLDTPFRIASLSKQFTAAAILRLQQEGRLSVSDPVAQYLPAFEKPPYDTIQIHHLLSHTSGFPKSPSGLGSLAWRALSRRASTPSEYVELAVKTPLLTEPGEEYAYSNFGFRILSAVIESITEESFADHMQESVFRPSALSHSGVARMPPTGTERLAAHGLELQQLDVDPDKHVYRDGEHGRVYASGFGSGGIYASANDLLQWHRVLNSTELLSGESKNVLFRPNLRYYAYGWMVKKSGLDGKVYQTHSGSNEGFFSKMMRVPEDDLVIIAVGNQDLTDELDEVITSLFRLGRGLKYEMP